MNVAVERVAPLYPPPPFHPSEPYPEYPYSSSAVSPEPNPVYAAVRNGLRGLGLDREHFGTAAWNPLGELLRDGRRVILKPNFVNHYNPLSRDRSFFDALVTQGAVVRPLLDYVAIAGRGRAAVSVVDLPIQSADFPAICRETGLESAVDFVRREQGSGSVEILDLRTFRLVLDGQAAFVGRMEQPGDRLGYATVELGSSSSLVPLEGGAHLFGAPDYEGDQTARMHSGGRHAYILPRTVLDADLIINIPKLKTHCKAGMTCCLKNLVGIIGDKSCLPHYRTGSPSEGGDEIPAATAIGAWRGKLSLDLRKRGRVVWALARPIGRALSKLNRLAHPGEPLVGVNNGNWYGNDTIWRMVHDLNRIALYADRAGILRDAPQRRYLAVVDGVIGGEGEGPLKPAPVASGLVVAGTDPVATDLVCAQLMGLDWRQIPLLERCRNGGRYPFSEFAGDPDAIRIVSSDPALPAAVLKLRPVHFFRAPEGWAGHIEQRS